MSEHTDKGLNLGNFVFDDNNQERQSWKCFGQTCNRSLVRRFSVPIFCYTRNSGLLYSTNNIGYNL